MRKGILITLILALFLTIAYFSSENTDELESLLINNKETFSEFVDQFLKFKREYPQIEEFEVANNRTARYRIAGEASVYDTLEETSPLWEVCSEVFSLYSFDSIQIQYDDAGQEIIILRKVFLMGKRYKNTYLVYIAPDFNFYYENGEIVSYKSYPSSIVQFIVEHKPDNKITSEWYYIFDYMDELN